MFCNRKLFIIFLLFIITLCYVRVNGNPVYVPPIKRCPKGYLLIRNMCREIYFDYDDN